MVLKYLLFQRMEQDFEIHHSSVCLLCRKLGFPEGAHHRDLWPCWDQHSHALFPPLNPRSSPSTPPGHGLHSARLWESCSLALHLIM